MKKLKPREVKVTNLEIMDSSMEVEKEIRADTTGKMEESRIMHRAVLAMEIPKKENGTAVMAAWAKLVADAQARMNEATQRFTLAQPGGIEEASELPKTKSNIIESMPQKCSQNDGEVPPIPTPLPPLHTLSRNNLQIWCQRLNISKNGRKHILYKRLMDHMVPSEQDTPRIEEKAQIMKMKTKTSIEDSSGEGWTVVNAEEPTKNKKKKREASKTALVQTASMAAWSRIMVTVKSKAVWPTPTSSESTRPKQSDSPRWCVVHGEAFPNNVPGSVPLEFHAGQTWVPENDILIPLLLLPTCSFPPPEVEDNWLCSNCVNRNKILMENIL